MVIGALLVRVRSQAVGHATRHKRSTSSKRIPSHTLEGEQMTTIERYEKLYLHDSSIKQINLDTWDHYLHSTFDLCRIYEEFKKCSTMKNSTNQLHHVYRCEGGQLSRRYCIEDRNF